MAQLSVTYSDFQSLAVISSSQMDQNFADIVAWANGNIETDNIAASGVGTTNLAASAVTTAKIADLNVTTGKINDLAVTTGKLAAAVFNGLTTVTAVTTDYIAIADASDSGNKKKALISDLFARSEVFVDTANGHGSTATKIRRFSNERKNTGTAITYADSAANGGSFTINEDGIYAIHFSDYSTAGTIFIAPTVDVSSVTTNASGLTYANGRRGGVNTPAANLAGVASWTGFLAAGAVVRAQTDGSPTTTDSFNWFSITQVSK